MLSRTSILALGLPFAAILAFVSTPADASQCWHHQDNYINHPEGLYSIRIWACPTYYTGEDPYYYKYKNTHGQVGKHTYRLGPYERDALQFALLPAHDEDFAAPYDTQHYSEGTQSNVIALDVLSPSLLNAAVVGIGFTPAGRLVKVARNTFRFLSNSRTLPPRKRPPQMRDQYDEW